MIKYDYEITVNGNQAKLNKDIYLFRGNKNVHYYFAVKNASFNFKGSTDLIEKTNAINAAVTVIKPNNVEVASAIAKVENGKIHLKVTEDLIDEEVEVGDFDLVFDLFDDTDGAVTIPKVIGQFHVLERPCTTPISELVATNTTNEVDQALTDYAITTYAEPVASTNEDGTFAKKTWVPKEKITTAELNRMEEGISDVSSQCKDIVKKVENAGQPTDTQITNAVNSYLENNPITLDDLWTDVVDGEIYEVQTPPKQIDISVQFIQGSTTIYANTTLDSLKSMLIVNKVFDDESTEKTNDYTLSGILTVGTSVITVTSGIYTKTFNVIVSEKPKATLTGITAVYTQGSKIIYPSTSLDDLKANLVVTATYSNNTNATITNYRLSGTLSEGTSTVTVTYEDKTTTFDVVVVKESGYVTKNLVINYDLTKYEDGYTGDVIDSISGITAECGNLNSYITGRNGFIGGKFMCNSHKTSNSDTYFKIPCSSYISKYPFSVEIYMHIRTFYNMYANNGVLNFENTSPLNNNYTIFNTRNTKTGSTNGYIGRILINSDSTKYFNLQYNANYVNISSESLDIHYQDINNSDDNTYVHLIFCCNGENTNKIYYNGQLVASGAGTSNATLSNVEQFLQLSSGDIKLVRIYQSLFENNEAIRNYNNVIDTMGGNN
nr:MAG TPA: Putative endo-beta-N-acetylglucosaminidase surface protein [Caudoviricetes sp.]